MIRIFRQAFPGAKTEVPCRFGGRMRSVLGRSLISAVAIWLSYPAHALWIDLSPNLVCVGSSVRITVGGISCNDESVYAYAYVNGVSVDLSEKFDGTWSGDYPTWYAGDLPVTAGDSCNDSAGPTNIISAELDDLELTTPPSGSAGFYQVDSSDYAGLKSTISGDTAILTATTTPADQAVASLLSWSGSATSTGGFNASVSATSAAEYTPQVTMCGASLSPFNIWFVWATLQSVGFPNSPLFPKATTYATTTGTMTQYPQWTAAGLNDPITQPVSTCLASVPTVTVQPANVPFTISSSGFDSESYVGESTGGAQTLSPESPGSYLPATVQAQIGQISWAFDMLGVSQTLTSGAHVCYVTYATPITSFSGMGQMVNGVWTRGIIDNTVTDLRLYKATMTADTAAGTSSMSAAAEAIQNALKPSGGYDFKAPFAPWSFCDITGTPPTLADCITLATLAAAELNMIGVPAQSDAAWPTTDAQAAPTTCTQFATTTITYQNQQFTANLMVPHNYFEGFFWINDPGVKAYTVFPPAGPFTQSDFYLQAFTALYRNFNPQYWGWFPSQTKGGVTVSEGVQVPASVAPTPANPVPPSP